MHSRLVDKHHSRAIRRSGLSVVEFVGCLVALCGGVAMGSIYLGVDLPGIAAGVLHNSQVAQYKNLASAGVSEDPSSAETAGTLLDQSSLDQSAAREQRDRTADLRSTNREENSAAALASATQAESEPEQPQELSELERATQAYWKVLNACVRQEAYRERSNLKNLDNRQLLDHLTHRLEGHQLAVDKIEQLDENGVDPKVLFYAKQVRTWHLAGVKLNQQALELITNGPQASLTGPVAQSWQSAATQHRMEEKLIQEKQLSVASYLAHTYKILDPGEPAASP